MRNQFEQTKPFCNVKYWRSILYELRNHPICQCFSGDLPTSAELGDGEWAEEGEIKSDLKKRTHFGLQMAYEESVTLTK